VTEEKEPRRWPRCPSSAIVGAGGDDLLRPEGPRQRQRNEQRYPEHYSKGDGKQQGLACQNPRRTNRAGSLAVFTGT